MSEKKHPDQNIVVDGRGSRRYEQNGIVRWLLDAGPFDMNDIFKLPCDPEDLKQFVQLIGYSLCGFGELFDDDAEGES